MIFMLVYFIIIIFFLFLIQVNRKLYFTDLADPKNPNLDCTDYADFVREIHLCVHICMIIPDHRGYCIVVLPIIDGRPLSTGAH